MSTKQKIVTALSIVVVTTIGILAYATHHQFTSAFIVLPHESVRMLLIPTPTHPTAKRILNK